MEQKSKSFRGWTLAGMIVLYVMAGLAACSLFAGVFAVMVNQSPKPYLPWGVWFIERTDVVMGFLVSAILVAVFYLAADMLRIVRFTESPFTLTGVRRLQWGAGLLAAAGAVLLVGTILKGSVGQTIQSAYADVMGGLPESLPDVLFENNPGSYYVIGVGQYLVDGSDFTSPALLFALAIVVFCVALVFRHGVHLQQQADETL